VATRKARLAKATRSHLGVMLASLAAGSAATVTALDSWDKILVDFGFKKSESAVLAEQGQQGDLLREMTRVLSRRDFWIDRYTLDKADGFPKEDQDEAWKRYNDSVVAWNDNYMLYVMLTEKYFGEESKNQLVDLNWLLHRVNTCLNKLRYRELYQETDPACHFDGTDGGSEQDNIRVLNGVLKQVDAKIAALDVLLSR
jgi:hypothetical protein